MRLEPELEFDMLDFINALYIRILVYQRHIKIFPKTGMRSRSAFFVEGIGEGALVHNSYLLVCFERAAGDGFGLAKSADSWK